MCAACVAQGVVYVGGALTGLEIMAARAKAKRQRSESADPVELDDMRPDTPRPDSDIERARR